MVTLREPVMADRFYPGSPDACRAEAEQYCRLEPADLDAVRRPARGGIVPHAGWICSGRVAGRVFAVLKQTARPQTFVLFGTMHRVRGRVARLQGEGRWATPLGAFEVNASLAQEVLERTDLVVDDPAAHQDEHSLEVQTPFIKHLFPDATILPILMPPVSEAVSIGRLVGDAIAATGEEALVIGSTDLTHYGPAYGFVPQGLGEEGYNWARDVNDRRLLDSMLHFQPDEVVPEAVQHHNACGPGAIAATMAAVARLGATTAALLTHTTSREVLGDRSFGGAVGYAGIVYS
ncbi:MAG: AmmeMemoRadiSam system protein B [Phycisphaerae bacterium]|nr:AmmeMemoRadiSam system protein B [Phycisphaerae bacterium]